MLYLESRGPGSIPTRGGLIFCFTFCNTNLYNIARSDRIRFKMKNSIVLQVFFPCAVREYMCKETCLNYAVSFRVQARLIGTRLIQSSTLFKVL